MDPTQFRKIGSQEFIDLRTLDETDEAVYNCVYYKEYPLVTGDMDETLLPDYERGIRIQTRICSTGRPD